jgi:hypothetical protein
MNKFFLGFLILCATPSLWADCAEYLDTADEVQYSRQNFSSDCFLSLHPMTSQDLVYRDYLLTDSGEIMVFNSYGYGPENETTAARVYYVFPRTQLPHAEPGQTEVLIQTATPGVMFTLDRKTFRLKNATAGGQIVEDPKVYPGNKGGVQILSLPTVWLDAGFAVGHDPTSESGSASIFHDANGKTCQVRNSEIFDYPNGDVDFKFLKDADLAKFLKKRCPNLTVNF